MGLTNGTPCLPGFEVDVSNNDPVSIGSGTVLVRITTRVPAEVFYDSPDTAYALQELGRALLNGRS